MKDRNSNENEKKKKTVDVTWPTWIHQLAMFKSRGRPRGTRRKAGSEEDEEASETAEKTKLEEAPRGCRHLILACL